MQLSRRGFLAATAGLAPLAAPAFAQTFPDRPIRLLVGFTAGGPTDLVARRAAQGWQEILGQSVVVENRTGAAGNIAADAVVRAQADGHTLLLANGGQVTVNPHTYSRLGFDPLRDLAPVAAVASNPFLLCASAQLGPQNHAELVGWGRRQREPVKYGTAGAGTIWHLVAELWGNLAGVPVEGVHYRGIANAVPDVLANRTPLVFDGVPILGQHVRGGGMRAMVLSGASRTPALPEAPSAAELGLPEFDAQNWFGLYAPRGTPRAVVERLADANRRALSSAALRERFAADGVEAIPSSPEELADLSRRDHARFGELARRLKITADE